MCTQAVRRLQETLDWRRDTDVESITCSACLADPRSHYMHPVGFDRLGRPVIYSCLQLAANRSVEDNRRHMIACFEQVRNAFMRSSCSDRFPLHVTAQDWIVMCSRALARASQPASCELA